MAISIAMLNYQRVLLVLPTSEIITEISS
jgi:hypothetical protein